MTSPLTPPEDLNDTAALNAWADRLVAHFEKINRPRGVEAARTIQKAIADEEGGDAVEKAVGEASIVVLQENLRDSAEAYKDLIGPVQKEQAKHQAGSASHAKLGKAIDVYNTVQKLFVDAADALDEGGPSGRSKMETAVKAAQDHLASLELDKG